MFGLLPRVVDQACCTSQGESRVIVVRPLTRVGVYERKDGVGAAGGVVEHEASTINACSVTD